MSILKTLIAARAVIADPKNWIKGCMWGRRNTGSTDSRDYTIAQLKDSDCFCALGAVAKACNTDSQPTKSGCYTDAVNFLGDAISNTTDSAVCNMGQNRVFRLNDRPTTTHADVLAAFDKGINLARERGV